MIADSAARLRALDVSQSFIVQAPAGSGKTELLIQRYLKLLGMVETPDAMIAITFTRKAAGEMRSRVIEALWAAQRGLEPEAEHERLTFQIARQVLEQDGSSVGTFCKIRARLRIETTDALCAPSRAACRGCLASARCQNFPRRPRICIARPRTIR